MKCSEVMVRDVLTCTERESLAGCALVMRDHGIGFLPIVDGSGNVVGTITDRDLVVRGLAEDVRPKTRVREIMSESLITCRPDEALSVAEHRMGQARKSRILVMDGQRCVGVISLSDIAQRDEDARSGALLRHITRREVPAASRV